MAKQATAQEMTLVEMVIAFTDQKLSQQHYYKQYADRVFPEGCTCPDCNCGECDWCYACYNGPEEELYADPVNDVLGNLL